MAKLIAHRATTARVASISENIDFYIIGISGIIAFLIKKGTFIKRPLNILYFFTFYLLPFTFYLNLSLSNKSPKPFFSFWSMFEHATILQNLTESIAYTPINKVI